MAFKRSLGNLSNINKELAADHKASRLEVDAALRAYSDAKRVVREAMVVKNLDARQFASLQHKMHLAKVVLDEAKYASFLVLKTGLSSALLDSKAQVASALDTLKWVTSDVSIRTAERTAERALTKALKFQAKIEYELRVVELKRVQGQIRDALWARSNSNDALREAEYSEESIVNYKLQVTFDEEALAYAKSKLLEIIADIRRMEKLRIAGMNPLE